MRKIFVIILSTAFLMSTRAQETVYPAPPETQPIVITNATVHVGNGQVMENASILIKDGKIAAVGSSVTAPAGSQTINAQGKHVYPGLILTETNLGLVDVNSVRATSDHDRVSTRPSNPFAGRRRRSRRPGIDRRHDRRCPLA